MVKSRLKIILVSIWILVLLAQPTQAFFWFFIGLAISLALSATQAGIDAGLSREEEARQQRELEEEKARVKKEEELRAAKKKAWNRRLAEQKHFPCKFSCFKTRAFLKKWADKLKPKGQPPITPKTEALGPDQQGKDKETANNTVKSEAKEPIQDPITKASNQRSQSKPPPTIETGQASIEIKLNSNSSSELAKPSGLTTKRVRDPSNPNKFEATSSLPMFRIPTMDFSNKGLSHHKIIPTENSLASGSMNAQSNILVFK